MTINNYFRETNILINIFIVVTFKLNVKLNSSLWLPPIHILNYFWRVLYLPCPFYMKKAMFSDIT